MPLSGYRNACNQRTPGKLQSVIFEMTKIVRRSKPRKAGAGTSIETTGETTKLKVRSNKRV